MNILDLVPYHPSHEIYDATKLKVAQSCLRKYFFTHILGWKKELPSIHLIHGEAWHRALATLYTHGLYNSTIDFAISAYEDYYRQFFSPAQDEDNKPKNPRYAEDALVEYILAYSERDRNLEILYLEVAGAVYLNDTHNLHFRLDLIANDETGKKIVLEHKTGTTNSQTWINSWIISMQTSLYSHVLHCLYNPQEVKGVTINGTFFYKARSAEFLRVPIRKSPDVLTAWAVNTTRFIEAIESETQLLYNYDKPDAPYMSSFPMNTESCTQFGTCPFFDICSSIPNPLRIADQPPLGYKIAHWDPTEREVEAKKVINIGNKEVVEIARE